MPNLSVGKLIALVVMVLALMVAFLMLAGVAAPAWTTLVFVALIALAILLL